MFLDIFLSPWVLALLIQIAALWLFFVGYNVLICSLPRLPFKQFLRSALVLVFLVLFPLSLYSFRHSEILGPILHHPTYWHRSHILLVCILTVALILQITVTIGILRPPRVRSLTRFAQQQAFYTPAPQDWDFYRAEANTAQPAAGEIPDDGNPDPTPLPPYTRPLHPVNPHPRLARVIHSTLGHVDETYDLRVLEFTLTLPNFPAAFDGLRVVQLSDNHYGTALSPHWQEHVVRQALALKPDLVALTGDFTAEDNLYRQAIENLRPLLAAPLGVFAVRGNHDFHSEPGIIAYWLRREGIRLLSNEYTDLTRGEDTLRVLGMEHPYLRETDWKRLRKTTPGTFCLALSHQPDNVFLLEKIGADMILTGHTHGGQWRLPLLGPMVFPSIHGRRFDRGLREVDNTLLYNSAGFGLHTIPFRYNCPPEIALFEFRRKIPGQRANGLNPGKMC